jgi:hypothetical protein
LTTESVVPHRGNHHIQRYSRVEHQVQGVTIAFGSNQNGDKSMLDSHDAPWQNKSKEKRPRYACSGAARKVIHRFKSVSGCPWI